MSLPRLLIVLSLLAPACFPPGETFGQCILANPSFELPGSGGSAFGGWNQFGSIAAAGGAPHGAVAARVSGPNLGGWDLSAVWQRLDSAPGDRWSAAVSAWHTSVHPLRGESRAILNIEWRDGAGDLIEYESHTVADASTPLDEIGTFSIESGPAPAGTAATHLLLGVLQGPDDPAPDVCFDLARFDNLGPPTLDEIQWQDFPGGRRIDFSARSWRVKGPGFYGPGPNLFCDQPDCTWVDPEGRLHLTITESGGSWYSTEVTLEEALGYGDYVFTTIGSPVDFDPFVVFGLFLWQYGPCYDPANGWWNPYNEIDVEFSRWGDPENEPAQFVVQPYDYPGNIEPFDAAIGAEERTSHAFLWQPDRIEFRSWRGGPDDESPPTTIHAWTYEGPHIPRPEQPRVHLNLWSTAEPSVAQEAILESFVFRPEGVSSDVPPIREQVKRLSALAPNPFAVRTEVRIRLERETGVQLTVYDLAGRMVRSLVNRRRMPAGEHTSVWDGTAISGERAPAGVYFYQLRTGNTVETDRIVLVR